MARSQVQEQVREDIPRAPEDCSANPDHHLWRNGRLWWVAFTVHLPGWKKDRIRRSLGTADLDEARRRRDELLRSYPRLAGCELSLRYDEPRRKATPRLDSMRIAS